MGDRIPGLAWFPGLLQHLPLWPPVSDRCAGRVLALPAVLCVALLAAGGVRVALFVPVWAGVGDRGWVCSTSRSRWPCRCLLGVAWWYLHQRGYRLGTFLRRDAWKIALMAVPLAGAVLRLWFVLDPDPTGDLEGVHPGRERREVRRPAAAAICRSCCGAAPASGAWRWAIPSTRACWLARWRRLVLGRLPTARGNGRGGEAAVDLGHALFLVFSLPSQRSERYLLPAMPALAVLCALELGADQPHRSLSSA